MSSLVRDATDGVAAVGFLPLGFLVKLGLVRGKYQYFFGRLLLGRFGLVKRLLLVLLLFLACWTVQRGLILPFILSGLGSA